MKRLKPWLLLALVFFAGIIVGVAATRFVVRRAVREAMLHPERAQMFLEQRLAHALRLDSDQQLKLNLIFSDSREHLQAIRQQYRPAVALVFSNASQQITAFLTPEQRVRFEKIQEKNAVFLQGLK